MNLLRIVVLLVFCSCSGSEDIVPMEPINITIDSFSALESNTSFDFKVRLSRVAEESISVDYRTEAITAEEGVDYESSEGTIIFDIGESQKTISIQIIGDPDVEQSEQFRVVLSNASGATIVNFSALGTIINDDQDTNIQDGYITPLEYEGYDLVWADEFDGLSLNNSNWTFDIGDGGWGNNELQTYTSDNHQLVDGKLIIEAREEEQGHYTSSRIISMDRKFFAFGRIDIRAKLPQGQGVWPALWMLGTNFSERGWPYCGEIDIMEYLGHETNKVHGTAHWGPEGSSFSISKSGSLTLLGGKKFYEEYHVFSIIWENDNIKWFVDDKLYHELSPSDVVNQEYPFNREFFFIMNIAVGGNWPGYPDETTTFPQQMYIDYVRVFQ